MGRHPRPGDIGAGVRRLYSRTGDDISGAFPDLLEAMEFDGALDGELLVARPQGRAVETGSFSDLQQRLNRKTVSAKLLRDYPAFLSAYDLLQDGARICVVCAFDARRARLERFVESLTPSGSTARRYALFSKPGTRLAAFRAAPPSAVIEGVMIKRAASAYVPGRPKGPWFKWKRDPFLIDAVLMYAQRGHGKRSGFYSDYTFGVWRPRRTGAGRQGLFRLHRRGTGRSTNCPQQHRRALRPGALGARRPDHGLVFEVAFEGINRSTRHKSGIAMRFPRISACAGTSRLRGRPAGNAWSR
jgi:DNA ligase-1